MSTEVFTLAEASSYLRISQTTLRRLVKRRAIKFAQVGGQYRFRQAWLDSYLDAEPPDAAPL